MPRNQAYLDRKKARRAEREKEKGERHPMKPCLRCGDPCVCHLCGDWCKCGVPLLKKED